jgi:hypothetical protein
VMEFNWDLKYIVFKFSMAYAVWVARSIIGPHIRDWT